MRQCAEDVESDSDSDSSSDYSSEEGESDNGKAQAALDSAVYVFSRTLLEQSFDERPTEAALVSFAAMKAWDSKCGT
jgi:hypothetical protein